MQQDDPEEIAGYLETFLLRENIANHSARQKAEAYLMLGKKERAMQDVLPDAQKLVSLPPFPSLPQAMVQLLAAKVLVVTPAEAQAFLMGSATALETVAELPIPIATKKQANRPVETSPSNLAKSRKKALPPLPDAAADVPVAGSLPEVAPIDNLVKVPSGERFTLKQGNASATAHLQANGNMLIMAGAVVATEATASLSAASAAARQQLVAEGLLQMQGEHLVLMTDYTFNSANRAAEVIVGRSVNGQLAWKHPSGRQVREFIAQ